MEYSHDVRRILCLLPDCLKFTIILEKAVESTASAYCTDSWRVFDDSLLHRMGDAVSAKNHQNLSKNQHIRHSRYDSIAFSRIIHVKYSDYFEAILRFGLDYSAM